VSFEIVTEVVEYQEKRADELIDEEKKKENT
jgi:hypothetical protein